MVIIIVIIVSMNMIMIIMSMIIIIMSMIFITQKSVFTEKVRRMFGLEENGGSRFSESWPQRWQGWQGGRSRNEDKVRLELDGAGNEAELGLRVEQQFAPHRHLDLLSHHLDLFHHHIDLDLLQHHFDLLYLIRPQYRQLCKKSQKQLVNLVYFGDIR